MAFESVLDPVAAHSGESRYDYLNSNYTYYGTNNGIHAAAELSGQGGQGLHGWLPTPGGACGNHIY